MTTWIITGCSTGLRRSLAEAVLEAGHNGVVTARDVATVQDLTAAFPDTALAAALDVTDKGRWLGLLLRRRTTSAPSTFS